MHIPPTLEYERANEAGALNPALRMRLRSSIALKVLLTHPNSAKEQKVQGSS
jgi:hypothetical protein